MILRAYIGGITVLGPFQSREYEGEVATAHSFNVALTFVHAQFKPRSKLLRRRLHSGPAAILVRRSSWVCGMEHILKGRTTAGAWMCVAGNSGQRGSRLLPSAVPRLQYCTVSCGGNCLYSASVRGSGLVATPVRYDPAPSRRRRGVGVAPLNLGGR